ncbi:uncharacterized protein BKA78DRAFT_300847 [Phyllosticta capitalensis]|uniref:Uncharacterized protein n=1 Tax=Phyllosticta capitalensis TaxID=121624 RepID=A0ABR1Y9N1_9PEZI
MLDEFWIRPLLLLRAKPIHESGDEWLPLLGQPRDPEPVQDPADLGQARVEDPPAIHDRAAQPEHDHGGPGFHHQRERELSEKVAVIREVGHGLADHFVVNLQILQAEQGHELVQQQVLRVALTDRLEEAAATIPRRPRHWLPAAHEPQWSGSSRTSKGCSHVIRPPQGITSDGSNPTDTGSKKDLFTSIRVIKLIVTGCVYVAHPDAQELLLSMEPKLTAIESDMIKANTGMRRRFLAQQATQHADTDLFLRDTQWPETLRGLTLVDVALMACLNHDDDPAFMTALRYLRRDALS